MAEYIEREALFPNKVFFVNQDNPMTSLDELINRIVTAPTIDAVEVVRCKECIHWYDREGVCLKIYSDGNVSADAWHERKPDDFCSYGERKDNNVQENEKL